LVNEFALRYRQAARVLWGVCDPLTTPRPLGPLADVAPALGGRLDRLLHDEAPREVLFGTFLFFVTEVLAAGDEAIPATVADAVLARAARLSPSARHVLGAAAVIAPPVQTWMLVEVAAMARRLGLEQPPDSES